MQVINNQTVSDVMIKFDSVPRVRVSSLLKDALDQMLINKIGIVCLVNDWNVVQGVFTDGDLRRLILKTHKPLSAFFMDDCSEHATPNPLTISPNITLKDAIRVMTDNKIWDLPVVNEDGVLLGMVHLHDLLIEYLGKL